MRKTSTILTVSILLIILIVSVRCSKQPQTPAPEPRPLDEVVYTIYEPILFGSGKPTSSKMGLAWSHMERGWPKGLLPYQNNPIYHNWGTEGGMTEFGHKISMVWSDEKNGYPYFDIWRNWIRNWELENGRPYSDYVLWANEPDRPDQADMTITETAQLYLDMVAVCPYCKMIGPGVSTVDDGQIVRRIWDTIQNLCNNPCTALNSRYAMQPHVFPRPDQNWVTSLRLDIYCDWVYGKVRYEDERIIRVPDGVLTPCKHPAWPTIGWRTCYPFPRENMANLIEDAELDPRIEAYFIFTTYQAPESGCHFSAMLEYDAWPRYVLSDLGDGVNIGFQRSIE